LYICALPKTSRTSTLKYLLPAQKEIILSGINNSKMVNTEITFLEPIYKALSFGIPDEQGSVIVSDIDYCQLRIIRTTGSRRASASIIKDVINVLWSFFDPSSFEIGMSLSYTNLVSTILSINGIQSLETIRTDIDKTYKGLSLFMWNPSYPLYDKQTITNDTSMREFEFLYFHDLANISQKIQVNEEPYLTLE
jgi:hypothetical protein